MFENADDESSIAQHVDQICSAESARWIVLKTCLPGTAFARTQAAVLEGRVPSSLDLLNRTGRSLVSGTGRGAGGPIRSHRPVQPIECRSALTPVAVLRQATKLWRRSRRCPPPQNRNRSAVPPASSREEHRPRRSGGAPTGSLGGNH